jgi:hypothetical protein
MLGLQAGKMKGGKRTFLCMLLVPTAKSIFLRLFAPERKSLSEEFFIGYLEKEEADDEKTENNGSWLWKNGRNKVFWAVLGSGRVDEKWKLAVEE